MRPNPEAMGNDFTHRKVCNILRCQVLLPLRYQGSSKYYSAWGTNFVAGYGCRYLKGVIGWPSPPSGQVRRRHIMIAFGSVDATTCAMRTACGTEMQWSELCHNITALQYIFFNVIPRLQAHASLTPVCIYMYVTMSTHASSLSKSRHDFTIIHLFRLDRSPNLPPIM